MEIIHIVMKIIEKFSKFASVLVAILRRCHLVNRKIEDFLII